MTKSAFWIHSPLEAHGFDVHTADSGEGGVTAVAEATCRSIVLMDIHMPGLDGVRAMHRMRARAPDLPVILMTAHACEALVAAADREATAVLRKPLDLTHVLSMLDVLTHNR